MACEIKLPEVVEPMSPAGRLGAIRTLAQFAQVHEALGDHYSRSECLPIPDREEKLREADEHYHIYEKAVGQLVALICDDEAVAQLDLIEAQCAKLGGGAMAQVPQAWSDVLLAHEKALDLKVRMHDRKLPQTERDRATVGFGGALDDLFEAMTALHLHGVADRVSTALSDCEAA